MRNPIRRSRKIGLTQGGRVVDGRPSEKWSHILSNTVWEQLSDLAGPCRVIRENPSRDFIHPCRGEEYLEVLASLPSELAEPVRAIILRRTPTIDEKLGVDARKRFSCVILNSFPRSLELVWETSPTGGTKRHYERWCDRWKRRSGRWALSWTLEEVQRYYLFHLFLHEVGHFHQPWTISHRKREEQAEDFALAWARRLGVLNAGT